jgi:tetratricopeptide (TPR) repeat protein
VVTGLVYAGEIIRTALSDFPYESTQAQIDIQSTAESIQGLEQALMFDGGNAQALRLLGDVRRVRASRAENPEEITDEAQKALDAYRRALKANPLDDSILARLGIVYDLLQRYPEAYLCYQKAVQAQPHNGQFWSALGTHFLRRGMFDKAKEAFLTAAKCPHGEKGAADSAARVEAVLKQGDLLAPPPAAAPAAEESDMP